MGVGTAGVSPSAACVTTQRRLTSGVIQGVSPLGGFLREPVSRPATPAPPAFRLGIWRNTVFLHGGVIPHLVTMAKI
ncbi:MAG: hypothetical protein H6806_11630 [Planctomycetes bacterium]|nr:hypothetical protein [Planctomycetota bacterium]